MEPSDNTQEAALIESHGAGNLAMVASLPALNRSDHA